MLKDNTTSSEDGLLLMLREGKPSAYRHLYETYWKSLFAAAFSRLDDEDAARDIVQGLFADLWERRSHITVKVGLEAYLFGAVKLRVLQYFRSEHIRETALKKAFDIMERLISEDELDAYLELEKSIDREVEKMPENMKKAFLLREEKLSMKEIAKQLGLSEQTVSNNVSEALRRIRNSLMQKSYSERRLRSVCVLFAVLNTYLMKD